MYDKKRETPKQTVPKVLFRALPIEIAQPGTDGWIRDVVVVVA